MQRLAVKASEARQNFSTLVDTVYHEHPTFVVRNSKSMLCINPAHLAPILGMETIEFHADFETDEDGLVIATLREIDDIIVSAASNTDALRQLASELTEYAQEYLTDSFRLYSNAPNRKSHFPYVLKVAMQDTLDDVIALLHVGNE